MALSRPLFALVGIFSGLAVAAACSNYVPPDVATYGPPNGLNNQKPGTPAGEDAGSTSSGGQDAGSTSTLGDSGGTSSAVKYECGTPIDGGPCTVSWTKDIYPNMQAGGSWNCGSVTGCHGGSQAPLLMGDEHAFYTTLANYTGTTSAGLPYFDPCSTTGASSDFECNVQSTGTCGIQMPLGATLTATDVTTITTWVSCGAPEN